MSKSSNESILENQSIAMPILPLRDVVIYPHMVVPLFVGREKSIHALEAAALGESKQILLVTQKESSEDEPTPDSIYHTGTISTILQLLKLPDGTVKVLVEGLRRGKVEHTFIQNEPYFNAMVIPISTKGQDHSDIEGLIRSLTSQFELYVKLNKKIPLEVITAVGGITDPSRLADTIAAHMSLKIPQKQQLLELDNLKSRIESLLNILGTEIDLFQVDKRIKNQVKKQMEKRHREYYLNEQIQAIHKELGELGSESQNEFEILLKKVDASGMPKEPKEKCIQEINKLKMMSPMAAEATVSRTYIDSLIGVPWKKRTKVQLNLAKAEAHLKAGHHGLEKVNERVLELLAVHKRMKTVKGPILCLVGPPGVGKTSLGQAIALATGREFVRMSLGGVRDEAEIRGHRRTYIGAQPGKIIQKLAKVKVKNPLFLLDEIDKMAMDFRGDPASALLEVLDPEQNKTFNDHYLEVDYDLSEVLFITTANSLNIPAPLLDRMEIIRLSGYTECEKLTIAIQYLIPKQLKNNGLFPEELKFKDQAILDIIRYYTREAGVRNLDREIAKICRKVVKKLLLNQDITKQIINSKDLELFLGVRKYRFGVVEEKDQIGQVTGLAWTEVGGEILTIEASAVSGKGKIISTGKLGEVMQESIQAALTVVRSRAMSLGIAKDFYENYDMHVHVPEGATPKDGPSAGIGMCTALVSVLTGIAVKKEFAMTGEITLRGQVLPIGGLKEKLLAAKRAGILNVIIPEANLEELKEINEELYKGMHIHKVQWIDEVFALALTRMPKIINPKLKMVSKNTLVKKRAKSSTKSDITLPN
ncbi:MAG: ATP-dependent protease La Type [Francisellaceae bacterium]|nr:ATP-dependent protease La Type [Francisellaceae bacterium]